MTLTNNVIIRAVQEQDANSICTIYNEYIKNTVVTFEEEPVSAADIIQRITQITADGLPWLVAQDQLGNVIGYAYAAKWRDRFSFRFTVEITVYLPANQTAKGLGTQLYQVLFDQLKRIKIHSAIGGITLPNDASVALHEKFGMVKVGHFTEVGLKFDRWLDVGFWQVTL